MVEDRDAGLGIEEASIARVKAVLNAEFDRVDPSSNAAELYKAFIWAMEKVYPPSAASG